MRQKKNFTGGYFKFLVLQCDDTTALAKMESIKMLSIMELNKRQHTTTNVNCSVEGVVGLRQ